MKTIIITRTFPDGTIKISCKPLPPKTRITELLASLNYQISVGLLSSYDIEIV